MPEQLEIPMDTTPRGRVRLPVDEHESMPRSEWETDTDPPCSGWWEVTDEATKSRVERWWFDGEVFTWFRGGPRLQGKYPMGAVMPAHIFHGTHAWRGMTRPSPYVYPTPPYDSKVMIERAQKAGVGVRTSYVSLAPAEEREAPPRMRVYL